MWKIDSDESRGHRLASDSKSRFKEHVADIFLKWMQYIYILKNRNRTSKSVLTKQSSHYICMENVKLIQKEDHYLKKKVKEAREIEKKQTP